ncbi:carbon-nitrogen hydrolase family protein [bacterium]|nr:carbon-nitrogen hydrolase family protein [bacterium]
MAGILNIQLKSLPGDKETNLRKIEYYIRFNSDKRLDLVVMPEFFATNIDYVNNAEDENGGETIKFIQKLAKQYNTNIVAGSVVRKVGECLYNTSFAIDRMGEIVAKYDKIHLYNYLGGNEGSKTTEGKKIVTASFDFAKVGLAICFDVRYPQMFRELARQGVHIITLPTAWLVSKEVYEDEASKKYARDMWLAMNRTRAYDNMVYYVVSDQTKNASDSRYGLGGSAIISPTAQVLAYEEEKEGAIYAEIDVQEVKYLKSIYPITSID